MCRYKICRICLGTNCKLYRYDQFNLKMFYGQVMGEPMDEYDNFPNYFCYECAALLHKFYKFRQRCLIGQQTLKEIQLRGGISYGTIDIINKYAHGLSLKSPIEVLTVSDKVKTYFLEDNIKMDDVETESVEDVNYECSDDENNSEFSDDLSIDSDDEYCKPNYDNDDDYTPNYDDDEDYSPNYGNDEESTSNYDNDELSNNPNEQIESHFSEKSTLEKLLTTTNSISKNTRKKAEEIKVKKTVRNVKKATNNNSKVNMKKTGTEGKIRERRRSFSEYGLKKQNPKFAKKRLFFYNTDIWKKTVLSEEEVTIERQKKAEDAKYKSATYKCEDCLKWYRKEEILERHRLRHTDRLGPLECHFCKMHFKWDCMLRKHLRTHFTIYECLTCGLVCNDEFTVRLHEKVHTGDKTKCQYCDKEFAHRSTYYTHLRTTHRSEFLCASCGMSFVSAFGLYTHRKIKHPDEQQDNSVASIDKDTFCEKCDIIFKTKEAYDEHKLHSAMHDNGLNLTGDGTKLRNVLEDANGVRENQSGKGSKKSTKRDKVRPFRKPTTCHICGGHFATQGEYFKHHISAHPGQSQIAPNERIICEICGASLAPGSMATHLNIHTREKLHPCDTCGRTFHSTVGLKRHLVTHTGEKRWKCTMCDKRFTQSNSMKLHFRTIHLKQPYPKRNRKKNKDSGPDSLHEDMHDTD